MELELSNKIWNDAMNSCGIIRPMYMAWQLCCQKFEDGTFYVFRNFKTGQIFTFAGKVYRLKVLEGHKAAEQFYSAVQHCLMVNGDIACDKQGMTMEECFRNSEWYSDSFRNEEGWSYKLAMN